MIVFTISNKSTGKIYVGTTGNNLAFQWEKIVAAAELQLDFPLYREIRVQGTENFTVEEWDFTDDRKELLALEQEAIRHFNAESLRGYKTSIAGEKTPETKKPRRKAVIRKSNKKSASNDAVEVDNNDGLPIKHVNAGGESVVRFDRKTTTVADAISGIGNRVPEHTYLHPLRRAAVASTANKTVTQEATDSIQETTDEQASQNNCSRSPANDQQKGPLTNQIKSRDILNDAMEALKQLSQPVDSASQDPRNSTADFAVNDALGQFDQLTDDLTGAIAASTQTNPDSSNTEYLQPCPQQLKIQGAIALQRQQLTNRCNTQINRKNSQLKERIDDLERLAYLKDGSTQ